MNDKINIHETAFVTAAFRAGEVSVSKDSFAHLWANDSIERHAFQYSSTVSPYEPYAHCLRNRYFYDTLKKLIAKNKIEVLINFGCGFSMYPFLLEDKLRFLEIDKPDVIAYKKEMTSRWQKEGKLPKREIDYLEADFNQPSLSALLDQVMSVKNTMKSFILLEGVLFFLGKEDTTRLFDLFNKVQGPAEYIGSVSFRPQLEKQPVFKKLIDFVESNLEKNEQFHYQTVTDEYYTSFKNYEVTDHQDTFSLSAYYQPERAMPTEQVLNEHMYLLKKIN